MADSLAPAVVDIALGNIGQQRPDHAGPSGRLTSLVNGEIVQYVPLSVNGPPKNTIRQRPGFISLSSEIRSIDNGGTVADDFHDPQLLHAIGDELVSIAHSVPRVYNGLSNWTQHDRIVATQTLSQEVIHTENRVVQAPDSAWLQGVECVVWNETNSDGTISSFVGFRAENGAWLVKATALFTSAGPGDGSIIRVCASNSTFQVFFVVCRDPNNAVNLITYAYDVHGGRLGSFSFLCTWLVTPGIWDLTDCSQTVSSVGYNAAVIQPGGWSSSDVNLGNRIDFFNWDGATVNHAVVTYNTATTDCSGGCAWLTKQRTLPANTLYFATVGGAGGGGNDVLHAYEVTNGAITHAYTTGSNTVPRAKVDALTGYAEDAAAGVRVGIAASLLAKQQSTGPLFDPALRAVVIWQVERTAAINLQAQHNGVLLQSRAFELDDHWHAVTFYESGPGKTRAPVTSALTWTSGDKMYGAAEQPVDFEPGASLNGGPNLINDTGAQVLKTQAIATITHNAGDGVVAATATWTLLNAAFADNGFADYASHNCPDSLLTVTGATPSSLNTTWRVISRPSATSVITENVGGNGTALVDSNLAGATCSLAAVDVFVIPVDTGNNGEVFPPDVAGLFIGGSITPAGAANAGNNTAFTIRKIVQHFAYANANYTDVTKAVCDLVGGSVGEQFATGVTLTAAPAPPLNEWRAADPGFNQTDVGSILSVQGAGAPGVGGEWAITSVVTGLAAVTAVGPDTKPYLFSGSEIVSIKPAVPLKVFIQSATFNASYLGSLLSISNAADSGNDGTYTIRAVLDSHTVLVSPATGGTDQRNETLASSIVIQVQKAATTGPALQPTWFVSPLNNPQQAVGRFENGLAFADWRFDADAVPNVFFFGLSTAFFVPQTNQIRFTLPYRAESFTADQTIKASGANLSTPDVLQTTVGLKDFAIEPSSGEAHNVAGTMLLPGLMGAQFNVSGFTDQGVSLRLETPFSVSQSTDSSVVGITPGSRRQYIVVAECTDENGERVFSPPSQVLDVEMTGTNNKAVISGRLMGPSNRVVGIAIYATAQNGQIQTTQHFKITNDLDINGAGFAFSTAGYAYAAGVKDTWQFTDTSADGEIQSHEKLYTDRGLLPRFPMPAFARAATWQGRVIALAYDGALWISGDKTEGDALWFHPGLRVTLPSDARASNAVLVDDYLMVFGPESFFYLPSTTLPDNTGQNGTLPNPVQLQFQGGCPGPAVGSGSGALYFNPKSGGIWNITRGVTNGFFSEDIREDLTGDSNVTGMAVDGQQRVYVSTEDLLGNHLFVFDQVTATWWRWDLPSAPLLLTTYRGLPVYQDDGFIMMESPLARFDSRDGMITAVPMDIVFSSLNFDKVRSFKRLWALQITGKAKGSCTVHATISYPDELGLDPTVFAFDAQESPPPFEINPEEETASTYGLELSTSFEGVENPGDSFEFEVISAEVGLEPGINRVPDSQRKAAR